MANKKLKKQLVIKLRCNSYGDFIGWFKRPKNVPSWLYDIKFCGGGFRNYFTIGHTRDVDLVISPNKPRGVKDVYLAQMHGSRIRMSMPENRDQNWLVGLYGETADKLRRRMGTDTYYVHVLV